MKYFYTSALSCLALLAGPALALPSAKSTSTSTSTSTTTSTSTAMSKFTSTGTSTSASASTTLVTATYDNIQVTPVVGGTINNYLGIIYDGFGINNKSIGTTGVPPYSFPNNIVSGPKQAAMGVPTLSVAFPFSSLSLESFEFGCDVSTAQGVVDAAGACAIQVTSYSTGSSAAVGIANFQITPSISTGTGSPMIKATLPTTGFNNIQNFTIARSPELTTAFVGDDFVYSLISG